MVFVEESQPIDTVLLILSKIGFDGDGNIESINFAAIKHLCDELPLFISLRKQLLGHSRRIRNTSLYISSIPMSPTSRGTSLTRVANVSVDNSRTSLSLSLIRPITGTIKKIT